MKQNSVPLIPTLAEDTLTTILIAIRDKKSMQEMCLLVHRSLGMVQRYCKYLEYHGYVDKVFLEGRKKMVNRSRILTKKGKEYLKRNGIKTESPDSP